MATVRSDGYSEIMALGRADFDVVCQMFPALKIHVLGVQKELKKTYEKIRKQNAKLTKAQSERDLREGEGAPKLAKMQTVAALATEVTKVSKNFKALGKNLGTGAFSAVQVSPTRKFRGLTAGPGANGGS